MSASELGDDTPITPAEKPTEGKARLMTLGDLDGRTNAAKAARAMITGIESDLGGGDRLSTGERILAARAGVAAAMIEDAEAKWLSGRPIDPNAYATLVNVLSRTLRTLGLQRRERDVTLSLDAYIADTSDAPAIPGKRSPGDDPAGPPRPPRPVKPSAMPKPRRDPDAPPRPRGRPPKVREPVPEPVRVIPPPPIMAPRA